MSRDGLLLTEAPPGERPQKGSFPKRNRLIAGLARATVVVEAAVGGGALITAEAALEQGKDVLAVPGPGDQSRRRSVPIGCCATGPRRFSSWTTCSPGIRK